VRLARLVGALLALGCAGSASSPVEIPPGTGVEPAADEVLGFYARTEAFYARLAQRRLNALETFNDAFLRDHFRSRDAFFDYYADLAHHLDLAHFEKSRPSGVEVEELVFETDALAWVQVRFDGADDRPMRPDSTHLVRLDRWELADGSWWLVPRKL
jgi:hypothetical protein